MIRRPVSGGYEACMSGARLLHLMSAGVLTGNELGTFSVVHPAIQRLPFAEEVRAEQEITRRYGYVMPAVMTLAVASGVAAARDGEERALTVAGTACYATMLAITLIGNVPINTRTLRFGPGGDPSEWRALRRRWDRLHGVRVVLDLAGLTCAAIGALRRP